jgi:hypothetical protein
MFCVNALLGIMEEHGGDMTSQALGTDVPVDE